jgi:hypothetical protein
VVGQNRDLRLRISSDQNYLLRTSHSTFDVEFIAIIYKAIYHHLTENFISTHRIADLRKGTTKAAKSISRGENNFSVTHRTARA